MGGTLHRFEKKNEVLPDSLQAQCLINALALDLHQPPRRISALASNFAGLPGNNLLATSDEVIFVIILLKDRRSSSLDISNKILTILSKNLIVINAAMRLLPFLSAWRFATIICIPEVGKPP